jgi:hypothetical protein
MGKKKKKKKNQREKLAWREIKNLSRGHIAIHFARLLETFCLEQTVKLEERIAI